MNQEKQKQPEQTGTNKNLIIVLVIILVLAAAFAGYFIWKYYSSSKGKTTTAVTSSAAPTATTTATVTQTTTSTTTTAAANSSSSKTISTDYVIADSNSRVISEGELYNFTPWQLKVARNEIYARHGRPFVHKDLQCYFAAKSWYEENTNFSENSLSVVENKNIATILEYEKKTNSLLMQKDRGC